MRLGDVSPALTSAVTLAVGAAAGMLAAWLADVLPGRYDIRHLVTGAARTRRNIAVVLLSMAASFAVALLAVSSPNAPLASAAVAIVTHVVLASLLVSAAAIDLEHMILPDEITVGGALFAVATAHFRGLGVVAALVGAASGLAIAYVPFLVYKRVRGVSGMGLGDAKLLVMVGAWQGWEGALFAMFAGAVQSVLAAVALRAAGASYRVPESVVEEIAELRARASAGDEDAARDLADDPMASDIGDGLLATRLPLGPFLALGAFELLFARRQVLAAFAWLMSD